MASFIVSPGVRSEEMQSLQRPFAAGMPNALRGAGSAASEPPGKGLRHVSGGTASPLSGSIGSVSERNGERGKIYISSVVPKDLILHLNKFIHLKNFAY